MQSPSSLQYLTNLNVIALHDRLQTVQVLGKELTNMYLIPEELGVHLRQANRTSGKWTVGHND